jgi:lipopolysaccharide biosynthesis glycosyltransferase
VNKYPTSAAVISFDDNYKEYAKSLLKKLDEFTPKDIEFILITPIDTNLFDLSLDLLLPDRKFLQIPIDYRIYETSLPVVSHFTMSMYARLFIPSLLPSRVTQSLYLDIDVLVRSDLTELFEFEINTAVGAVAAESTFSHLSVPLSADQTFYAGLLIINHKIWQKDEVLQRCLDIATLGQETLSYPDNDLLVMVLNTPGKKNWESIPTTYNYMAYLDKDPTKKIKSPKIVHFPGKDKPWNAPFGGKYARQWRSDFKEIRPDFKLPLQKYNNYLIGRIKNFIYKVLVLPVIKYREKNTT